ncbi:peptidase associated/transthyretin-like domain-containing protein [Nitrososphaera viennensis]|uniref:Uncharacterized protein n=2 Tax=Nitrososphaera viennensis TaxID=1034015 RepID=A0A060HCP5_9ARCH|nr:hypothetical protein [Nitrososphaera viennensis]AIC14499.1 hypothetical protein NVIE_003100 [Nitrososphaera viennensis EN76]UVS69472.1 hypothetical protein NWT39_01485 [Nitrososphaera viennensis]
MEQHSKSGKKVIVILVGVIIALGALSAYLAYGTLSDQKSSGFNGSDNNVEGNNNGAATNNATSPLLALSEVTAKNENGEKIGTIEQSLQIKNGQPITLHAVFTNPSEKNVENVVVLQVRDGDGNEVVNVMNNATIAGSTQYSIDSMWHPDTVGKYTMFIYVFKPKDVQNTDFALTKPVKVAELEVV